MTDAENTPVPEVGATTLPEPYTLSLEVAIEEAGPCRKHVKVTIPRKDIDHHYQQSIEKFQGEASVPGFRPGHVPAKLVEKRFKTELESQVKQDLLMESLEQLSETHDLDPINQPEMDVENLEIPEEGDFQYEFTVEVRPEFDLPDYGGLQLERPVRQITDEDVEESIKNYLVQYGTLADRDGSAERDDYVQLSLKATHNGKELRDIDEFYVRVKPTLRFADAELEGFDKLVADKVAGDTIETEVAISTESEIIEMRDEKVSLSIEIHAVKQMVLPELDKEFLSRLGMESEEELRDAIRSSLDRQLTYDQRQSARRQVLEKITESATWELPEKLVLAQADNAMRREMLEMQQAGFTTAQIRTRENQMRQKAITETRQALKEHFVLDKIADKEAIEVTPSDIEMEIYYMALQSGENPRRVRARLQKSGMIENLEAQIRERKAIDVILQQASFTEVEQEKDKSSDDVEAINYALCRKVSQSVMAEVSDEEDDAEQE